MSIHADSPQGCPVQLYGKMGPRLYEMLLDNCQWSGPHDLAVVLANWLPSGGRAVDVGIGSGQLSALFRARAMHITGIDGVPEMIRHCLSQGLADSGYVCDLRREGLPLSDRSSDLVVASGLLTYLSNPAPLIAEMIRITAPGGIVAVNFHPACGEGDIEYLPAGSLASSPDPYAVTIAAHHHDVRAVSNIFQRAGAEMLASRYSEHGIFRILEHKWVPLQTMAFRV